MADLGMVGIVVAENQFANVADIHVVRLTVAKAVERKFREFDGDCAGGRCIREYAFLIVMEVAVAHGEIVSLLAYANAIVVDYRSAAEFNVLNRGVRSRNYPDAFALGILASGVNMRAPAAYAADGEVVGGPGTDIANIGHTGIDCDDVAGHCRGDCGAWFGKRLTRSNLQRCCMCRCRSGQRRRQSKEERVTSFHPISFAGEYIR